MLFLLLVVTHYSMEESISELFSDDPKIRGVNSTNSIVSGYLTTDVEGSGFSLLQRPRMVLYGDEGSWPVQVGDF